MQRAGKLCRTLRYSVCRSVSVLQPQTRHMLDSMLWLPTISIELRNISSSTLKDAKSQPSLGSSSENQGHKKPEPLSSPSSANQFAKYEPFVGPSSTSQGSKVFVSYKFYKGKAALQINPVLPEFSKLKSGAMTLSREGTFFLTFANATGPKQYDWSRKQIFALNVLELGTLLSLGPKDSCEFMHDPFMGKSDAGKLMKRLKIAPMPNDQGFYFNFYVSDKIKNIDDRINVSLTKAEFALLKSCISYIIPYLMGWHAVTPNKVPSSFGLGDKTPSASRLGRPVRALSEWNM
eukprot:TRINITY_DN805_c0_g1_i2.p1 TRINITY_DN805_c0_g1~~TRINITY_DN805_c0_g1_i2.p1  ORF type:complete len:291 (-),score=48.42 TRINITY_DN805_c0_g1_i2:191-1063(-)